MASGNNIVSYVYNQVSPCKNFEFPSLKNFCLYEIIGKNQNIDLFNHIFLGFSHNGNYLFSYTTSRCLSHHQNYLPVQLFNRYANENTNIYDFTTLNYYDNVPQVNNMFPDAQNSSNSCILYFWAFNPLDGNLKLFNKVVLFNHDFINENSYILLCEPCKYEVSMNNSCAATLDIFSKDPDNLVMIYACGLNKSDFETAGYQRSYKCHLTLIIFQTNDTDTNRFSTFQSYKEWQCKTAALQDSKFNFTLNLKHEMLNTNCQFFKANYYRPHCRFLVLHLTDSLIAFRLKLRRRDDPIACNLKEETDGINSIGKTTSELPVYLKSNIIYYTLSSPLMEFNSADNSDETTLTAPTPETLGPFSSRNSSPGRSNNNNDSPAANSQTSINNNNNSFINHYLEFNLTDFRGQSIFPLADQTAAAAALDLKFNAAHLKIEQKFLDIESFLSNFINRAFFDHELDFKGLNGVRYEIVLVEDPQNVGGGSMELVPESPSETSFTVKKSAGFPKPKSHRGTPGNRSSGGCCCCDDQSAATNLLLRDYSKECVSNYIRRKKLKSHEGGNTKTNPSSSFFHHLPQCKISGSSCCCQRDKITQLKYPKLTKYRFKNVIIYDYDALILDHHSPSSDLFPLNDHLVHLNLEFLLKVSYVDYSPYDDVFFPTEQPKFHEKIASFSADHTFSTISSSSDFTATRCYKSSSCKLGGSGLRANDSLFGKINNCEDDHIIQASTSSMRSNRQPPTADEVIETSNPAEQHGRLDTEDSDCCLDVINTGYFSAQLDLLWNLQENSLEILHEFSSTNLPHNDMSHFLDNKRTTSNTKKKPKFFQRSSSFPKATTSTTSSLPPSSSNSVKKKRRKLYITRVPNFNFWSPKHHHQTNLKKLSYLKDNFHILTNISLLKGKSIKHMEHPSKLFSITL